VKATIIICAIVGICALALALISDNHSLFFLAGATLEAALVMWVMRHDT
jgi:hypothetical protein